MPIAAAAVNYDFDYKTIVACFRDCSSWCLRVNIIKYFPLSRKTFNSGKVTFQGGPEHLPILAMIWTLKSSLGNEFNRRFNVTENNNQQRLDKTLVNTEANLLRMMPILRFLVD